MISVKNLSKSFGDKFIFDNLSFDILDKQFVVLVGPSGSGKSTLLRILAGLDDPTSGEIFIDGKNTANIAPKDRSIGMVFQNYALYPHFTVSENLSYPLKIKSLPARQIKQTVAKTAEMLEIEHILNHYPRQISGGQKQRVAIGRCLVREPSIFLFDEPLSNLDARLRENLRREILKLHQMLRRTSIYVTHDQIEAMALGEVIVVLNAGKIQQIGSPKQVYQKPQNLFVAEFIGSPLINKMRGHISKDMFNVENTKLSFTKGKKLPIANGKKCYACIRPEKIKLSLTRPKGEAEAILGKAKFDYLEYLGAKALLEFNFEGVKLLVESQKVDFTDSEYNVYFNIEDVLWFDENGSAVFL